MCASALAAPPLSANPTIGCEAGVEAPLAEASTDCPLAAEQMRRTQAAPAEIARLGLRDGEGGQSMRVCTLSTPNAPAQGCERTRSSLWEGRLLQSPSDTVKPRRARTAPS